MENVSVSSINSTSYSTPAAYLSYNVTTEMWVLYIVFYIILALIAIAENVIIVVLIAKNKKLRTFFFVLIAGHCIGQIVMSLGNIIVAVYRLIPVFTPRAIRVSRLQCHAINVLVYFAPSFSAVTMLILAIDRAYALGRPLSYQKRSLTQGLVVIVTAFIFTIVIKLAPSYVTNVAAPFTGQVLCVTSRNAVTPEWWTYNYYLNCVLVFLGVGLYLILMVFAVLRTKALRNGTFSSDDLSNRLLQRQLKLLNNIRLLIVINVSTVVPFTILLILSNYYEPSVASRLVVYGASLNAIDMVIEPIVLLLSSAEMKRSFLNVFGRKDSKLFTISNTISIAVHKAQPK